MSLLARRRTGEVARVDVAMVEAVTATVGEGWMAHLATGEDPPRIGNHDVQWAPHNCYRTAGDDDWITIACTTHTPKANGRRPCAIQACASDTRFEYNT